MDTTSSRRVLVSGGGPAGLSCALWLRNLGLRPLVVEAATELGGTPRVTPRANRWLLGSPDTPAPELAERFTRHVAEAGVPCRLGTKVSGVDRDRAHGLRVELRSREEGRAVEEFAAWVIATGSRPRGPEALPELHGVESLLSRRLVTFHPLGHLEPPHEAAAGPTAVIGGGDNAYFTATDRARAAERILLIQRSAPRAQQAVRDEVERLETEGRVRRYESTRLVDVVERGDGLSLRLETPAGATVETVQSVHFRLGFVANSEFLRECLEDLRLEGGGFIRTDLHQRTNVPMVYAAGDVTSSGRESVVEAIAEGATAARSVEKDLRREKGRPDR